MAKIKQKKMRLGLNPARTWEETVVEICYDATDRRTESYRRKIPDKRFYIKLPQVMADALGVPETRGDDQDDVLKVFEAEVERFKNLKKETNRVILYRIDTAPDFKEKKAYTWDSTDIRIVVWVGTYLETVAIAGDGVRRYSYEHVESPIDFPGTKYQHTTDRDGARWKNQIPWTDRNEKFFVWVQEHMTELAMRLGELNNPDLLIETVNAGRLLPLGESSVKQEI